MIIIKTNGADKEAVRQSFMLEFTKMILCGMGIQREEETVKAAMAVLAEELEINETENGFTVGSEDPDCDFTAQDCAFSVADGVFGKNNYNDEFGSDYACMSYTAKQLLAQYPEIEIDARLFLDTEWSNTVEIVRTEGGQIITETEEF